MEMGAIFDPTGIYRYALWRSWNPLLPRIVFIMLNPSTADSHINDPTIRRCIQFAQTWGYGTLEVVNLFGLKTTDPQELLKKDDPVGVECDRHLGVAIDRAEQILVAWGNWGCLHQRDRVVMEQLPSKKKVYCLGINRSGQPRHPLYVKRDTLPTLYNPRL
ncbi:MAG: DUF1643 domain-containing protein [Cyanobacteria bacterium CRU_2_1]|nr:DUF1643 domain-containing protein [Cyanobacteria bacterium CRU_2_1]